MATPQQLADRRYRAGVALRRRTEAGTVRLWRGIDRDRLDASWAAVAPRMVAVVSLAQAQAARDADDYTSSVLRAQDIDPAAAGEIVPEAFAGVASDGRPLDSLLYQPIITTKHGIATGSSPAQAMQTGLAALRLIVATQVADAGRTADGVALTARRRAGGYVRMLAPPSCSRCAILAGKWFRWNQGFQRHPRCDCRHIPSSENLADDLRTDPRQAVEAGQVEGLSRAERQSIVDGADPAAVVNSRRGMYTANGRALTREGTRLRGAPAVRLRPEQIYRDATSRDDAIRLLQRFGYIR